MERELAARLPSRSRHTKNVLLHRPGRDFTERDVLVLELLRLHLAHLWERRGPGGG